MKFIDNKLAKLKAEVSELADHCEQLGDEKTRQLLLEVEELLDITHSSFLGKSLNNIMPHQINKQQKH
ncbi:hypothetical protein ACFO4O_18075 [Glaciecola siphonariae]|uniref:Uncharacterized protein n=1 Tax=Glaciecola siphonariae TaxID=521012 RepID=A0ABV9LZP3_9ALTE